MADRPTVKPIDGLHDRAGHLARRFQQFAVAHFTRRNGAFGVTSVQYAILIAVRERPDLAPLLRERVREAVSPWLRGDAVYMPSATWLVSAQNPG